MSDPTPTTPLALSTGTVDRQLRISLKPGMPRTGAVDGAWWPASRDLVAELPALAEALRGPAGRVQRVAFGRTEWEAVPARARGWVDGRRIGLDGFAAFAPDVVWVATSITGSAPLFLVVVPADTPPERAAEILRRAGSPENLDGAADLLADRDPSAPMSSVQPVLVASHG